MPDGPTLFAFEREIKRGDDPGPKSLVELQHNEIKSAEKATETAIERILSTPRFSSASRW
jgi:hypothetical protein